MFNPVVLLIISFGTVFVLAFFVGIGFYAGKRLMGK